MNLSVITSRYNREARLAPAFLVAMPLVITLLCLFPPIEKFGLTLFSVLGFLGSLIWLAQLARDRGKSLEPKLYECWGGMPSIVMLRHTDPQLPAPLKERYKSFLRERVSGIRFPSAEEEAINMGAADEMYHTANAWLLTQTRDTKHFKILFEENINYGFRRNFWALKPFALTSALTSIGILVISWANTGYLSLDARAVLFLVFIYLLLLIFRINSEWVRIPANAYARQLLASCDTLNI